jgi:hypothetical protein
VGSNPTASSKFLFNIKEVIMENPATWTPLHHELHEACYHSNDGVYATLRVLQAHNYQVTIEQVQAIFDQHQYDIDNHFCGFSLPSMLVNNLTMGK